MNGFMRIWSIHPKYLDVKGIVALWREALLAKNVLEGKTKGYKSHPQLNRFKAASAPVAAINQYLAAVYEEAERRGYHFDKNKINWEFEPIKINVTSGQMNYERQHLLNKLSVRDKEKYSELSKISILLPHPIFQIVDGEVEEWEII